MEPAEPRADTTPAPRALCPAPHRVRGRLRNAHPTGQLSTEAQGPGDGLPPPAGQLNTEHAEATLFSTQDKKTLPRARDRPDCGQTATALGPRVRHLHQTRRKQDQWFSSFRRHQNHLENLLKHRPLRPPHPLVSDPVGLTGARPFAFLSCSWVRTLLAGQPHSGTSAFQRSPHVPIRHWGWQRGRSPNSEQGATFNHRRPQMWGIGNRCGHRT